MLYGKWRLNFRRHEIGGVSCYALHRVTQAGLLEKWGMLNPVMAQDRRIWLPTGSALLAYPGGNTRQMRLVPRHILRAMVATSLLSLFFAPALMGLISSTN
jgi:hypothetical protein